MLNRKLNSYTNNSEYLKLLNDYSAQDLFKSIDEVSEKLITLENSLSEAKSDYSYWSVISDIDLYNDLQKSLIYLAYKKISSFNCKGMKSYFDVLEDYNRINSKINQSIKDLKKYKPTNYKLKIVLLEDLLQ